MFARRRQRRPSSAPHLVTALIAAALHAGLLFPVRAVSPRPWGGDGLHLRGGSGGDAAAIFCAGGHAEGATCSPSGVRYGIGCGVGCGVADYLLHLAAIDYFLNKYMVKFPSVRHAIYGSDEEASGEQSEENSPPAKCCVLHSILCVSPTATKELTEVGAELCGAAATDACCWGAVFGSLHCCASGIVERLGQRGFQGLRAVLCGGWYVYEAEAYPLYRWIEHHWKNKSWSDTLQAGFHLFSAGGAQVTLSKLLGNVAGKMFA